MYVRDIVELAKIKLHNLPIAKNEDALIKFIYLGTSELFRRFNLSIKSETITVNENLALYELRNEDVSLLLGVYDKTGRELQQTDVFDSKHYEYKLVNYRSFLLHRPFNGLLYTAYKASPILLKDMDDRIDLPDAMIDALLCYISYMSHTTINRDNINESNIYQQRFDAACRELETQGYKIPLSSETLSLHAKGFV